MAGIPWGELYGCQGRSADVPEWLRTLRGGEPASRDTAYLKLFDHVCHQGSRWQVSAVVVPHLVALIDDPSTSDRARLVDLLIAVAIGDRDDDELPFDAERAYPQADDLSDEQEQQLIRWLYHDASDDADFFWDRSGPDRWERRAYAAAAKHAATVAEWVGDEDELVAALAAALLAWFPPAPRSVALLVGSGRAAANLTLAHLPTRDPSVDRGLIRLLDSADEQISLTAAIALAYRHGPDTPEPALTMLAEAADHDRQLPPDVPGWDRALRGFVARGLGRIGW